MKAIAAAALAGIAMASTPSLAADLFGTAAPLYSTPVTSNQAAEVGSNWYIRGDVGVEIDSLPTVSFSSLSTPPPGDASTPLSPYLGSSASSRDFAGDIGFGYRFNNYVRLEATYEYRSGPGGLNTTTVICPYTAYGIYSQTLLNAQGAPLEYGYLYNPSNTCDGNLKIAQHNSTGLVSGYIDLGTYWGITPYVGAGGGVNANTLSGTLGYVETANGAVYAADLSPSTYPQIWVNKFGNAISPQPNIAFAPQNWNRSISSTRYTMAWALMVGVGIQISPSATLDIGYRYLDAGVTTTGLTSEVGSVLKQPNTSQEVRIGIRYMAD